MGRERARCGHSERPFKHTRGARCVRLFRSWMRSLLCAFKRRALSSKSRPAFAISHEVRRGQGRATSQVRRAAAADAAQGRGARPHSASPGATHRVRGVCEPSGTAGGKASWWGLRPCTRLHSSHTVYDAGSRRNLFSSAAYGSQGRGTDGRGLDTGVWGSRRTTVEMSGIR